MQDVGNKRENLQKKQVSIRKLKCLFTEAKFSNSELSQILLLEPDEMSIEAFISKTGTWLSILDVEKANNLQGGK
ncbi:MAG: hypothetical protein AMDU5_GPLC00004G0295 [Thermoplasmatales archaeon Gpl]|jgi:hypothetical protein|nr:MAG: hypothetical protein AMDU5_GPLC00004G0295 [Thermoplasmatales archaeon Gpl]